MGELMRSLDWSTSPLGPVESWPQSLKTSVSTCLNSRFAILIWWGKDLVKLYNDAYMPILGNKHPKALGASGREVWPEIWHIIGPMLEGVIERGEATWSDNLLLELERDGYPEECYFTFSYSPIRDESGGVGGIFTPVQETTAQVIGERRLRTLRDLAEAARAPKVQSTEEICQLAAETLAKNPFDVPFAAFYLFSSDRQAAHLIATSGVEDSACTSVLLPGHVALGTGEWLFSEAASSGTVEIVSLPKTIPGVPRGAWPVRPVEAMVLPVAPGGQQVGFLICAISPRKHLDEDYRAFLSLVGNHVTTAFADARALEQERKRAEALEQLDHAKTQFFSNVSHEFRTPLTLLLGPLEDALRLPDLSAAVADCVHVAHRNALRLLRLVNSLLNFSRIEAGRINAVYERTDISMLTVELASSFRAATDRANLRLEVDCPSLSQPVYVDREMWEMIVFNLLSNAFKFTFNGHITVRLRETGGQVELQVSDTGIGIPEAELPRLFERFHRVEGAHGRTHEGTGIGLALVQELVRLHGGVIHVDSQLGRGSTFSLRIPFGKEHLPTERLGAETGNKADTVRADAYVEEVLRWLPDAAETFSESPDEQPFAPVLASGDAPGRGNETILLADDNSDMRGYIQRLLSSRYQVVTAGNGTEALERALIESPDLVLADIMMPGLDGFGLLRALRAHRKTARTPVILLSARAGDEARSEGMDAGADDYLVKPFSARELVARVSAHLRLARLRKEAEAESKRILTSENRKWRELFAQVPAAVAVLVGPDQRFEWVNNDYLRLTNRTAPELVGKPFGEAFPEIAQFRYDEILKQVYRTGQPYIEREAHLTLGLERQHEVYVTFVCLPRRGLDGAIEGIFIHASDVTDLVVARKLVESSEQQFRTLAESIPHLAWMADENGSLFWFNRRWFAYTGQDPQAPGLVQWEPIVDPVILPAAKAQWERSISSGQPFEMILPLKSKDGAYRQFLTRVEPLREADGHAVRWFGTNTDISEQRHTEEELRRVNRELEEFAYVASHDLREPLRMVNIYTQLLLRRLGPQPEAVDQYASFIRTGVNRMEALIDDLLTFSRTVRPEEFPAGDADLSAAFGEAMTFLQSAVDDAGATVLCDPLPSVRGDASQFTHVFQNLISNALKYRNPGVAPLVSISAERREDEWVITVRDNGIGFEQQYAKRIFGLFKRLHKEQYPGTGLGLAICQRIVERYGGRIWADSVIAQGSAFHFALPAVDGELAAG